jgi:hypothetical protein
MSSCSARFVADSLLEGMDSKFQFRGASPPPTAWASFISAMSGGSLSYRSSSIGFAGADNRSDDSAAPTIGRPRPDPAPRNRCLTGAELTFRIHSAPAVSPSLTGSSAPRSRTAAFRGGLRAIGGGAVGRDGDGLRYGTPIGDNVSAWPNSSTAVPVMSSKVVAAFAERSWSWLSRQAKPSTLRCSCQVSGRRECASNLSAVKSRG